MTRFFEAQRADKPILKASLEGKKRPRKHKSGRKHEDVVVGGKSAEI